MLGRRALVALGVIFSFVMGAAPTASAVQVEHSLVVSADPADYTPNVLDRKVLALAQIGSTMYVGGTFEEEANVGGPTLLQTKLFAFDTVTGLIDESIDPYVRGNVNALATDGTNLYVGGTFSRVSGVPSSLIAKLGPAGNVITAFKAQITGTAVHDLNYANGMLYVGGAFSQVNGTNRSNFAIIDATDGSLEPINVRFTGLHNGGVGRVTKFDISPDGTKLVAVGNFTSVAGTPHDQIAMLNLTPTTATVADWTTYRYLSTCNPVFDSIIKDVDISPDGEYFVVGTTGSFVGGVGGGTLCDTVTRWELNRTGSGQQPSWINYLGGDTTWSVATTGAAVYIGGHMRWVNSPYVGNAVGPGTIKRNGMAGLDPLNGMPIEWEPGRDKGQGVFSIIGTETGLWYGHDTGYIGGEYHGRLAFFPLDGGAALPVHVPATLPGELYSLPSSPSSLHLDHRSFDGTTADDQASTSTPQMDWANARGAFYTEGRIYYGLSDGTMGYRAFNGTTLANKKTPVYLHGLSPTYFPIPDITGMFFDNGRIYYTVSGDPKLYYRYFTPESGEVGAVQLVASYGTDGFDWDTVRGMTFAEDKIYVARTDGSLYSIDWTAGDAHGSPVIGSQVLIDSNPAQEWASNGMFVLNS